MKKIWLILLLLIIVFIAYNHQRLYVHDPLATVTRDGVKDTSVQVLINYSNDVILIRDQSPRTMTMVHHGLPVGELRHLGCLQFVGCMADSDTPVLINVDPQTHIEAMTSKIITIRDRKGTPTLITLF